MAITQVESEAAIIGRFRRLAAQTMSKGMGCSVTGSEIRGILAALDAANVRADRAEEAVKAKGSRGKGKGADEPVRSFDDQDVIEAMAAVDDMLHLQPAFWGETLATSLPVWCLSSGDPIPESWLRMIVGV